MNFSEFSTEPFHISYALKEIMSVRDQWTPRLEGLPFWTLGSATYKDYREWSKESYEKDLAEKNAMLVDLLPDLYRFQLYWTEERFKAPAKFMKNMPLPGFHIFHYHDAFLQSLAKPHVDVPFNDHERSYENEIFTFVVCVTQPKQGAFMRVWDVGLNDLAREGAEEMVSKVKELPSRLIAHRPDQLILHSGRTLHMIEPWREPEIDSWRITLQGHAVKIDGVWNLYW